MAGDQAEQRMEVEELGARLVCETPGMPVIDLGRLERHRKRFGSECVDDLLPFLGLTRTAPEATERHITMRRKVRASSRSVSEPWSTARTRNLGRRIVRLHEAGLMPSAIADRIAKSDRVVSRYLREAGLLKAAFS
jgi:hypothetical protein